MNNIYFNSKINIIMNNIYFNLKIKFIIKLYLILYIN
jgi:hypothetical protein